MRKLEEFVTEKLKVSKESPIILDTDIYELHSNDDFNSYLRKVDEWLHSYATKVSKNKSNKNILNTNDLYIFIDTKYQNYVLSIGYKNKETVLFMPVGGNKLIKSDYTTSYNIGWSIYNPLFIVPEELKDNVIEIINTKFKHN
jgi:hypothetical protein